MLEVFNTIVTQWQAKNVQNRGGSR